MPMQIMTNESYAVYVDYETRTCVILYKVECEPRTYAMFMWAWTSVWDWTTHLLMLRFDMRLN